MKVKQSLTGVLLASSLVLLAACGTTESETFTPQAPSVSVATVINEKLTEWDEFTGRIQAPETVELRPRISGYIDFIAFEEGAMVEEGEPLFFIDNRSFKAEVKRLKAELMQAKSQYDLAKREFERANSLAKTNAVSQELVDTRFATQQQSKARVSSVSAALELAKLNLSYTRVTAPISGRVSNAMITKGNFVTAGQSVLTTLVSTKEVFAYFDADEQTYLKYSALARDGSRPSSRNTRNPVRMGLASDQGFPRPGVIDFVDNTVNVNTGTIRGRAVFDNQDGTLIPGLFARIRLLGSASYQGILIDDKAIGTDLNNKFVLVLDSNNNVQYRAVTLGEKLSGLRIIKSGLSANERIVINGLQRVRPGSAVNPQFVDMTDEKTLIGLQAQQREIDQLRNNSRLAAKPLSALDYTVGG